MKPVEILTVKNKLPLWKKDEPATNIELIQLEEVGFEIVSQKDLYQIGDKAVYIQPDYCLNDISLFESFLRPNGESSKCKLGSKNRIRAIKFNFHRGDGNVIYSQGILLPYSEVQQYILSLPKKERGADDTLDAIEDIGKLLQITKWEEPEDNKGTGVKGGVSEQFPQGMYRTDEENINNLYDHIFHRLGYPITLVGTEKIDGSSISIYYKDGKSGITSRNLGKPLSYTRIIGRRGRNLFEKLLFWTKPNLNIYEQIDSDSDFVKIGKPYLEKLVEYCRKNNINLVLRGELNGQGLKGSGNKNNPSVKELPNIKFYGVDDFTYTTAKLGEDFFDNLCKELNITRCKVIFTKTFNTKEEIIQECNNYFKDNMIEGLVLRTLDHNFSCKFMNLEYDSKK